MSPLLTALHSFVATYHGASKLVDQQRDWHSRIALVASDSGESINLHVQDGKVSSIGAPLDEVDLVITAADGVLVDILTLKQDPNEPYLFGDLTVKGNESHFMRLDYVVTMLCPH